MIYKKALKGKITFKGSLSRRRIREFYKKNVKILPLLIVVTIALSFIGLLFRGILGCVIGLVIGLIVLFLVPSFKEKVWQITDFK